MTRKWLRWLPAATVPAVIAAGVLAGSLPANAGDPLPDKSPAQVLALVTGHRDAAFSGTVEQTSSLGLPELPPASAGGDTAWLELLTGPHTARVYRGGPEQARIQVLDRFAERNVVRNGQDLWFYNSKDNTAAHAKLPAGTRPEPRQDAVPQPDRLAEALLARLGRSSDVTVGPEAEVAGRAAYRLVLTPRSSTSLLAAVEISVDGRNGMPLGVQVKARGQSEPAFSVAFSKLSLEAPDASVFRFSPPQGAAVKELPVPDHRAGDTKRPGPNAHGKVHPKGEAKVSGTGWESVVELPAGAFAADAARQQGGNGDAAALLAKAAVPVPGGKLLSTALLNVLILDDGRVLAVSVPLERLQAVAAGR
ncbi:LolA family protein [Arthrobacter sp. Hor0625]|uniref:LolA family protein n=1 Tax=Arthrobacter sp. Hor0625 TaxID=3457358 RepID=UPI00403E50FF